MSDSDDPIRTAIEALTPEARQRISRFVEGLEGKGDGTDAFRYVFSMLAAGDDEAAIEALNEIAETLGSAAASDGRLAELLDLIGRERSIH